MKDKNTPKWIYVLRLCQRLWDSDNWSSEDAAIIQQHFEYLKSLTETGTMIMVGRTDVDMKDNIGIAVFAANTKEEAEGIMNADPCIMHGIMTAELFPFRLSLFSKHFLFDL